MKKILFVCLGNICRSPAAEGIMKELINKEGLPGKISADSAGLIDYHIGELPDARIIRHAEKRGYKLKHKARLFDPEKDFGESDYIIVMDNENMAEIKSLDPEGKYSGKIFKMTDFCIQKKSDEVPDPFYGGSKNFEQVLDILEDACRGLIRRLADEIEQQN